MHSNTSLRGTAEGSLLLSPAGSSDPDGHPSQLLRAWFDEDFAESYIPPEYNLLMGPLTDHAFG
eukprot:COSAG01_NODE_369_length_18046_cov_130.301443_19_plen_64_part_00